MHNVHACMCAKIILLCFCVQQHSWKRFFYYRVHNVNQKAEGTARNGIVQFIFILQCMLFHMVETLNC